MLKLNFKSAILQACTAILDNTIDVCGKLESKWKLTAPFLLPRKKKPEDKKERYTESNKKSEHPAALRWDNSTQIRASADHTQAVKEFIG